MLILAPGQEALYGYIFDLLKHDGMLCVLIRIARLEKKSFSVMEDRHTQYSQISSIFETGSILTLREPFPFYSTISIPLHYFKINATVLELLLVNEN